MPRRRRLRLRRRPHRRHAASPRSPAVDLAGSSVLTVRVGSQQAVVVHADDNLIDLVTTDVEGGTLVVGTSGNFTTQSPMTVDVTVPTLETVVLSGSGVVTVEGVTAARLAVRAPGSGVSPSAARRSSSMSA